MSDERFNLEEKDIYKLFNNIKLEESEFDNMNNNKEIVSDIQKEKIKKNLNKKIKVKKSKTILKYGTIAATVSMACLIGVGVTAPTFAKDIPVVGSIIQRLNDGIANHNQYAKFSQMINKSVTDSGITVTINEALADDSKVVIGYTIKSEKEIPDLQMFGLGMFLNINNKCVSGTYGSSTGKYIDKHTYIGSENINVDLPKKSEFNIDLKIDNIVGIKGNWKFAFSVSKDELLKNSTIFTPNNKIEFPDSIVNIDKVVCSPINTSIFISGDYKNKNREGSRGILDYDYWIAYDDNGIELITDGIGGGTSNSKTKKFKSQMSYERVKNIPKYITIIPCKINPIESGHSDKNGTVITKNENLAKEISKPIDSSYPIELKQGKFGKIVIKEIRKDCDKTVVKFVAQGKAPYFQATSLHMKDENGAYVEYYKNYNIKRSENNPNEFTMEFVALDSNKKYNVTTSDLNNVEFREDLKFNINLSK